jgi:exodeoxyribonuclease-3
MISQIKIMSFNIAAETLCKNNNIETILNIIKDINPDILGIQETHCHNEKTNVYTDIKLYEYISKKLNYFYEINQKTNTAIFSKFPIENTSELYKGIILKINDSYVAIFNIHLTDEPYQPYQLTNIKYGDYPFIKTEEEAIHHAKLARENEIKNILNDVDNVNKKYNLDTVVLLGDFNEPSHKDWTNETVIANQQPIKICFPTTKLLNDNGFTDSYRFIYPNPVLNNGYTWPVNNNSKSDRIDYIFVKSNTYDIYNATIVGEKEFIDWPSDHRVCICILNNFYNKYKKYKIKYKKLKQPSEL